MADVPHFDFPFRVHGSSFRVVEQDSDEELSDCVYAALATELGQRDEAPDYGIDDPSFANATLESLRDAVLEMEPRADALLSEDFASIVRRIQVEVGRA